MKRNLKRLTTILLSLSIALPASPITTVFAEEIEPEQDVVVAAEEDVTADEPVVIDAEEKDIVLDLGDDTSTGDDTESASSGQPTASGSETASGGESTASGGESTASGGENTASGGENTASDGDKSVSDDDKTVSDDDKTVSDDNIAVDSITLDATATVYVGKTTTLQATISPNNATNQDITWSSNDTSFATVDEKTGVVTGVAVGTATITATVDGKSVSCTVTVEEEPVEEDDVEAITLDGKDIVYLYGGDSYTINATTYPDGKNVNWDWQVWSYEDGEYVYGNVSGVNFEIQGNSIKVTIDADFENREYVMVRAYSGRYDEDIDYYSAEDRVSLVIQENVAALHGDVQPSGNDLWAAVDNAVYTGSKLTPEVRVYNDRQLLYEGTDYTVTYKNNVNANVDRTGTKVSGAKQPQAIVKFKGNYSGSLNPLNFNIAPKSIDSDEILVTIPYAVAPSGTKTVNPSVTITRNGKKLSSKNDYSYIVTASENDTTGLNGVQAVGTYYVQISGKGNYTGTRTEEFYVVDGSTTKLINSAKITTDKKSYVLHDAKNANGEVIPTVTVKLGKNTLKLDTSANTETTVTGNQGDYVVDFYNNDMVGTATVVVTGVNGYAGTKTATFKITAKSLKKVSFSSIADATFDYSDHEPSVTLTDSGKSLVEDSDYSVYYSNNYNAGKATVTFTGWGDYTGTVKKTFKIKPVNLNNAEFYVSETGTYSKSGARLDYDYATYTVSGDEGGYTLQRDRDYTISYKSNKKSSGEATAIIKGKGNFTGTLNKSYKFTIEKADIEMLPMTAPDRPVTSWKATPVIKDGKYTLSAKNDYQNVIYTDEEGKEYTGDYTPKAGDDVIVTVSGKGNYGAGESTKDASGNDIVVPYTNETTYHVYAAGNDISKLKVSVANQTYDGYNSVTLDGKAFTFKGKTLTLGTDYVITGYTNNYKKGNATVTIKGIGQYGGTKTVKFKITAKSAK